MFAKPSCSRGFTVLELLVVVAAVVLLLAVLMPALDNAIYQAELAVCAAQLHGIGNGATTYAMGNANAYPNRPTSRSTIFPQPSIIKTYSTQPGALPIDPATTNVSDDRPYLVDYLDPTLKILLDPLSSPVQLTADRIDEVHVGSSYMLWFGFTYTEPTLGGQGLIRMGQRLEWTDNSRGRRLRHGFNALASDMDVVIPNAGPVKAIAGHPDRGENVLFPFKLQQNQSVGGIIVSYWRSQTTYQRGPLDTNYNYIDGSVRRFDSVDFDDDRMARTSLYAGGNSWGTGNNVYVHMPPQPQ